MSYRLRLLVDRTVSVPPAPASRRDACRIVMGKALQARRCNVQLGSYEQQTEAHMSLYAAKLRFIVVSSLRRSGEGQDSAYAGRDGAPLIGTTACRACPGGPPWACCLAKLSCAGTSPISRSHVRAARFPFSVSCIPCLSPFPPSCIPFAVFCIHHGRLETLIPAAAVLGRTQCLCRH
jgi:hypothetical protein